MKVFKARSFAYLSLHLAISKLMLGPFKHFQTVAVEAFGNADFMFSLFLDVS